jgi:hypothetical protein
VLLQLTGKHMQCTADIESFRCSALAGPPGAKKQAPKRNLFLIYVDALSLVNNKRAAKSATDAAAAAAGEQQTQQALEQQLQLQRQLSAAASAAPNMPDFTLKDLQFILTFTGGLTPLCQYELL